MVKGLQRFREHFRGQLDSFIIIGGVACDQWLELQGLTFRPTKDVDMVLVIEALRPEFVNVFWDFVRAGRYDSRQQSTGRRTYYRFSKPVEPDYPVMIEIFCRQPPGIDLSADQQIVPIDIDDQLSSLSAILMEESYYQLILGSRILAQDLPIISATGLIPLKARAWLDMKQRQAEGKPVDADDIRKHRRDVFRLAAALPAGRGPTIPEPIRGDLRRFMASFPAESPEWGDLSKALKNDLGGAVPGPQELLAALTDYFSLEAGTA